MPEPKTTALMLTRGGRPECFAPEAEPVIVEATDDVLSLVLDDGEVLTLDRRELLAAGDLAA